MPTILIMLFALVLSACGTTPVTTAENIQSKTKLVEGIAAPTMLRVAYYADSKELSKTLDAGNNYGRWRHNVGRSMAEAMELATPTLFKEADFLKDSEPFHYLFVFSGEPGFGGGFATFWVDLTLDVYNPLGEAVFHTTSHVSHSGGGAGDGRAFTAVYANAIKDTLSQFLNSLGPAEVARLGATAAQPGFKNIEPLLDLKPASTGTGFYVNNRGQLITANHVVRECVKTEVQQKGKNIRGYIRARSKVLDLALMDTNQSSDAVIAIPTAPQTENLLGRQVFVTGYPLSQILSPYPSLTVGNISSAGGLRGASGYFQYSAPTQPGNSGGPILDYKGNLVGTVTSSLNQVMMLERAGTTSQNVNFALSSNMLLKFLHKHAVGYPHSAASLDFESASKRAVDFTSQVLCYR